MDESVQKVSIQLEAAMDAIQSSSHTVAVVFIILTSLLALLFSASIFKRLTDRVVRSKIDQEDETFFSYFPKEFNVETVKKIISEAGHYRPPWWYSPNLGTMIAFGKDFDCVYDEEIVEAADGCRFIVSWYPRRPYLNSDLDNNPLETVIDDDTSRKSIALYVPGLGLHADSKVSKNYALRMSQRGYTVGIVGVRGERLPLTCHRRDHEALLRPWHPALIDDLLATILRLHRLLPSESRHDALDIFLTGYSAGGNIVQKTLQAMHQQRIRPSHAHHPHHHLLQLAPHTPQASPHRSNEEEMEDGEQQLVRGAFVVCVNFDYWRALRRLEQTLLGRVYSFFMCRVSTDILRKHRADLLQQLYASSSEHQGAAVEEAERMMQDLFPAETAAGQLSPSLLQCQWLFPPASTASSATSPSMNNAPTGLLSDFDAHVWRLRGFASWEEQFRSFSMFDVGQIAVPTLMLQPRDDPLHLGDALRNIDLETLRRNDRLVFMSPRCGNHFGFYEGGLWQAVLNTNGDCYSYPAKVSASFFQSVLDQYLRTKPQRCTKKQQLHLFRGVQQQQKQTQQPVQQLQQLQRLELKHHDHALLANQHQHQHQQHPQLQQLQNHAAASEREESRPRSRGRPRTGSGPTSRPVSRPVSRPKPRPAVLEAAAETGINRSHSRGRGRPRRSALLA